MARATVDHDSRASIVVVIAQSGNGAGWRSMPSTLELSVPMAA
jgi:hypothetical protein